jgi:hypothetical protein
MTRRAIRSQNLRLALLVLLFSAACGSGVTPMQPDATTSQLTPKQLLMRAMLTKAKAGRFQAPPKGYHYAAPVDCRVDSPHGFHGQPIYLCKISITKLDYGHLYEWGAWYHGALHTHATDPTLIKTITGPFDPPF